MKRTVAVVFVACAWAAAGLYPGAAASAPAPKPDRLGDRGWEMVTHVRPGAHDFDRLKRPAPPTE